VTYELLTGKHPFNRKSAPQARSEKMHAERPQGLERTQWRTLSAALSFDRASRTASVNQFLEGMGVLAPTSTFSAARLGVIGAAAVVVAGGLWLGYRALSGNEASHASASTAAVASAASVSTVNTTAQSGGIPSATGASTSPVVAATSAAVVARAPATGASVPTSGAVAVAPPVPGATALAALNATLSRIPCSALAASLPEHALEVSGFASTGDGVAHVREALAQTLGGQGARLDVNAVGSHNCEVVSAFAPYWRANHQAGAGAAIHTRPPDAQLTQGSPLIVDITTPQYDSYVNVDYYALDGSVVHLVPSNHERDNQAPPGFSATIGSSGDWVVDKPFGTEMIVLLVTPAPLFDGLRPPSEPRAAYLAAVDHQLKQMEARYGSGRIAADFVQITTHARGE
jgi:eukaryotic-like serine/threonine-protein kinase